MNVLRAAEDNQSDYHTIFCKVWIKHGRSPPVQEEGVRRVVKLDSLKDKVHGDN